ncbi:hypothetical protein F7725_021151 [Dissostichus mawsoni]|uniref:Ig-like domain-containing protein n=1 Tax=Dissostichus mawsoni TaxID=36200 RepID=A0A7J5YG43_DISMA|nr:hypothetical protein F7725_021151 [Dissostichus mawsoni]
MSDQEDRKHWTAPVVRSREETENRTNSREELLFEVTTELSQRRSSGRAPAGFSILCFIPKVKAKPGEDVTLHCNCTTDAAIALAEWKRSGLETYVVLYFRDNKLIGTFHNPQFHGLLERKGYGSVVLKNVSVNDTGNYTCLVRTLSDTEE